MELIITTNGTLRTIYEEAIDLTAFGPPRIVRASHVEPLKDGSWSADLSPVGGPALGPFAKRSDALAAEADWLEVHWLTR